MSLVRLLKAGKSLVGGTEGKARYHLTQKRLLPRFESKQNPFRATARPENGSVIKDSVTEQRAAEEPIVEEAPSAPTPTLEREPARVCSGPETGSAVGAVGQAPSATSTVAPVIAQPKRPKPGRRLWRSFAGSASARLQVWAGKPQAVLKSLVWWGKPRVAAGPHRSGKPMVQSELSLDAVKVVRNDLSDSDLEVVRARQRVSPASSPPVLEEPAVAEASSWGRVAGRWLGVGKP